LEYVEKFMRSKHVNEAINAIVTFNDRVYEEAEEAYRKGAEPVPIGIKDIIYTKGLRTTMGSKLFKDFIPNSDAIIVSRLKEAGFVIAGKTNTHEFASGATTTSSIFGPTKNPIDTTRIAGGSSGGSAAAVAAGLLPIAVGTDTAGSCRIPASLCGVYGIKPTYGLISLKGVYPLAPSFDTVGFLAEDPSWIIKAITSVVDVRSLKRMQRYFIGRKVDVEKILFGVPSWMRASEPVEREFYNFISKLNYVNVDMPITEKALFKYFTIIRLAEATQIHLSNKDRWSEYFPDVRRMLEKGLEFKAVEYIEALRARVDVYKEFKKALKKVDLLITPTTMVEAPKIDDVLGKEDGEVRTLLTHNLILASYLGVAAISVPKLMVNGLPVGVQLIGDRFSDLYIVEVAKELKTLV